MWLRIIFAFFLGALIGLLTACLCMASKDDWRDD